MLVTDDVQEPFSENSTPTIPCSSFAFGMPAGLDEPGVGPESGVVGRTTDTMPCPADEALAPLYFCLVAATVSAA